MIKQKQMKIPRYTQIAGYLRAKLEAGDWPVGTCMPAIDQLAENFEVAPQTMRQSLIVLEGEGLIQRKQGVGTIVLASPREQRWLKLPTDWETLVNMLSELEVRRLVLEDSEKAPTLNAEEGEPCAAYKFLKRVHYRKNEPFCVLEAYLSAEIYIQSPMEFRTNIIIPHLANRTGVEIGTVKQNLRVDVADADIAKHLDIPLAGPVVKVRRIITDKNGAVIYMANVAYRGDVVTLEMDLSPK